MCEEWEKEYFQKKIFKKREKYEISIFDFFIMPSGQGHGDQQEIFWVRNK